MSIVTKNNLEILKCYANAQLLSIKTNISESKENIVAIDEVIESCSVSNIALIQSNLYKNKAKNLAVLDKFDLAIPLIEFVIQNTEGNTLSKERRDAFKLLGTIYSLNGNLDKAYGYLNKSYSINSAIQNNLGSKNLAYQKVKYAHLDQEAQVKILDQENQLLKLNAEVEKQYKNRSCPR